MREGAMRRRWLRVAITVGVIALVIVGIRLIAAPAFIPTLMAFISW
jgi:hypothetical protein